MRRAGLGVALVAAPLAVAEVLGWPATAGLVGSPPAAVVVVLVLAATLPLALIDVRPRAAVVASAAGVAAAFAAGQQSSIAALALLVGVGLCAFRAGREAAIVAAVTATTSIVAVPLVLPDAATAASTVTNALLIALAALVGYGARVQRGYAVALEGRARELERLRATESREAVAQERVRIAREVHDVVGHALAAIALHARVGARRLDRDPPAAAAALAEIAQLAASALADTRDAVGQLRTGDETELRPQSGLGDLDELVAGLRASAIAVALRREGDGPPVPAVVQSAAYRIVQESLSNVARHARPTCAAVVVRREPQALHVEVTDDGGGDGTPDDRRQGHGLIGMRERAAGLGGTLEAGPSPDGGWRVRATLPTPPVAA